MMLSRRDASVKRAFDEWIQIRDTILRAVKGTLATEAQQIFKEVDDAFTTLLALDLQHQFAKRDAESKSAHIETIQERLRSTESRCRLRLRQARLEARRLEPSKEPAIACRVLRSHEAGPTMGFPPYRHQQTEISQSRILSVWVRRASERGS